jgi:hypothetical protein
MNKNYLILFMIILALVTFKCNGNKTKVENMAVIKGKVFLKGDPVSDIFEFKKSLISSNPLVSEEVAKAVINKTNAKAVAGKAVAGKAVAGKAVAGKAVAGKAVAGKAVAGKVIVSEENRLVNNKKLANIWEGKKMTVENTMKIIETGLKSCDVNDTVLKKEDLSKFNNRKRLIKLIPLLKEKYRSSINYENIKCYVTKFEPHNYINISKLKTTLASYIPPKNTMIINKVLYHFTPFGVIKYSISKLPNIDSEKSVLNASFESTIINDINTYNTTHHPIFVHRNEILQIRNNKFYNIANNGITDLTKIFANNQLPEEESFNLKNRFDMTDSSDKYLEKILYIFHHSNYTYIVRPKGIFPNFGIGKQLNEFLKKNNTHIKGVIPHFYHSNNQFNIRFIFLCGSNFYFDLNNDTISELKDFKKDFGYSFAKKIPYKLSCEEHKIILDQLVKSNKISNNRKMKILRNLKC